MSHFGVLVLTETGADEEVETLLAPFDENLEVDEYERECWCVGREARDAAMKEANRRTNFKARLDAEREVFRAYSARASAATGGEAGIHLNGPPLALVENPAIRAELEAEREAHETDWKAIFDERDEIAAPLEREHPDYRKPRPTCEECGGTGRERTTSNPRGFWDWWEIGGRWAGALDSDYDPSGDPRNFSRCDPCGGTGCNGCQGTGIKRNWSNAPHGGDRRPVAELPEELASYALVTPDGQWHAQGRMGWFGMSADVMTDETWASYLRAEIAKHPDAVAIVVDCHV